MRRRVGFALAGAALLLAISPLLPGLRSASEAQAQVKHNCSFCHNLHGGSYSQLRDYAVTEDLCLSCHSAAGPAQVDRDGTLVNVPKGPYQAHTGSRHAAPTQCWDCHNHEGEAGGNSAIGGGLAELKRAATAVDKTLAGPVQQVGATTTAALDDVEKKIVQAVKRESEIHLSQLEKAQVHLFPQGKPAERVVNILVLRSMQQAKYSAYKAIHFGLASDCYTHFTSPIRRYPDLILHRMLARVMAGDKLKPNERADLLRALQESGKHTSERERHAMDAEREMVDLKKAQFMMTKMGEEFSGFVNSLATFGFFVELDDYFIEDLVKSSSLTDDDYDYYEKEYLIKGRRHG